MPGKELQKKERVFGLDLMRAMAIVLVLFAHCSWILPSQSGLVSQLLALAGFLGVEIFFVLSGFLIGRIIFRIYTTDEFTFSEIRRFLKRRWYRTLPNYYLILVVNLVIAYFIGYHVAHPEAYFLFLQNFAWPLLPFFPESWSLSVEEFAYLILPVSLFGAMLLFRHKARIKVFVWTILILIAASIVAKCCYHFTTHNASLSVWNIALKSVVLYRLDAIFIGVLFSWICSVYGNFWKRSQYYWLLAGIFLIGFFSIGIGWFHLTIDSQPFFWNVVYLPAVSLSIAFFLPALSQWKTERSAISKPITFISLISYSIYLLHYSVVLQSMKQFFDTGSFSFLQTLGFTAAYLAITLFLSYFLYRFYELPMMNRRERGRS